jgi:hypothetical protein
MAKDHLNRNPSPEGPFILSNWLAANEGEKIIRILEYPLFTDARITGEVTEGYGPYKFLNPVPIQDKPGLVQPGIFLRLNIHFAGTRPDLSRTSTDFYHGGWLPEEISALASLALGIRLKAGGNTRLFELDGDPLGRPIWWDYKPTPILIIGPRGLVLPGVVGSRSLEYLQPLSWILSISPENIIALIRAARFYQDSLWIGESEPSLSWIMLVSALETAADQWRREQESPLARLKDSKPKLFHLLEETGIKELPQNVAALISDSLGATKKFIDFVLEFLPNPPIKRPAEFIRVDWSANKIKNNLRKIYSYRSKALHGGTPFPAPMCDAPIRLEAREASSERPLGSAAGSSGGTWLAEDIPMLLHTFEYITRGTLLNWWKSISDNQTRSEEDK